MKRFLPAAALAAASEAAHAEVRTYVCVFAEGKVTPGVSGVDWRRIDRIIVDTDDATIRMNDSQAKGIEEEILGGLNLFKSDWSFRPLMGRCRRHDLCDQLFQRRRDDREGS